MRLAGKVALVTGAAMGLKGERMGIGGATAWMFAREGAKVALCDVNEELGQTTASQIREEGHDATFVFLDVTSEQGWINAIQATVSAYGKLDILVNSAGNSIPGGIEETTVEVWDDLLAVHAKGPFLGTKHAIPEMRKVGGGSIINISSINGLTGSGGKSRIHGGQGREPHIQQGCRCSVRERENQGQLSASWLRRDAVEQDQGRYARRHDGGGTGPPKGSHRRLWEERRRQTS